MALISRTLRLKLVAADPSEVPKSCHNLMVSIHAIAPFSALDEYLKPRIAGVMSFRPELTPGLLQALAGSGLPSSAIAQSVLSRIAGRPGGSSAGSTLGNLLGALTANSSSNNGLPPPAVPSSSTSMPIPIPSRRRTTGNALNEPPLDQASAPETSTSEGTGVSRRRSLRLRGRPPEGAEPAAAPTANEPAASTSAPVSSSTSPSVQNQSTLTSSLLQQLLVDDGDIEEDMDDEVCLPYTDSRRADLLNRSVKTATSLYQNVLSI
jgi:E3 ubiquitin-protein ligase TRIP12